MQEELARAAPIPVDQIQGHPSLIINAFTKDHIVVLWNDRCADHFGIPPEAAVGKKLEDLLPWAAADERLQYINRALMGTRFEVSRVPFKMKPGYYEQTVIPVKDQQGNVIAALNIVSEQRGQKLKIW